MTFTEITGGGQMERSEDYREGEKNEGHDEGEISHMGLGREMDDVVSALMATEEG